MKRVLLVFILGSLLICPACLFAQTATIIDVKGEVLVKKNAATDWQDARKNVSLDKAAQIQTKAGAECVLAFDKDMKNIVTVKENTLARVDSVKPGNLYLSSGRVFTLVSNLKQIEKFQVRTPTAVAGARGTGWATGFSGGDSSVACFEDTVFVQGLDPSGNVTDEQDLESGFGLEVGAGGRMGDTFELSGSDRSEWNDFSDTVNNLTGGNTTDEGPDETGDRGAFMDLRDEGRDTYREEIAQEQREEIEAAREETVTEGRTGGTVETGVYKTIQGGTAN